jgi:hypothetical protein
MFVLFGHKDTTDPVIEFHAVQEYRGVEFNSMHLFVLAERHVGVEFHVISPVVPVE